LRIQNREKEVRLNCIEQEAGIVCFRTHPKLVIEKVETMKEREKRHRKERLECCKPGPYEKRTIPKKKPVSSAKAKKAFKK
ncbi:MAG: hypothetical protein KAJ19_16475, partial [Gammaproteobacteria bacterium]|nr:hypothetical protein [Gammaproteobacteria bacterium]